jgi:hypothetical protein
MERTVHEPTSAGRPAPGFDGGWDLPHVAISPPPRRRRGRWVALALTLAVIASASLWVIASRQYIVDQVAVWSFDESPTIASYVERSRMSDRGEFLFLASRPTIADRARFGGMCGKSEDGTGILGCYVPGDGAIVLFDVVDERLDGIEEVVASHEMLHAAWHRLGADERAELSGLLETEAAALSTDPGFVERMALYARLEPGERSNELHSIIGTEVADLPPALESYYARYFSDRAALVGLHTASNAVFVELASRAEAVSAELDALRTSIEADYAAYNGGYDALNDDVDTFNERADAGLFSESARAALVARQDALDALFASITERSAAFDAKAAELESLNAQTVELNSSVNIVARTVEPPE